MPFTYKMEYRLNLTVFLNTNAWQSKNLTNLDHSLLFFVCEIKQMKQNYGIVPGSSVVKNPPVKEKTRSLGQEDPLEKEMATTPVSLPGKSHGQRSLVGYSPRGQGYNLETKQQHTK